MSSVVRGSKRFAGDYIYHASRPGAGAEARCDRNDGMAGSYRCLCPLGLVAIVTLLPLPSRAEQQTSAQLDYERPEDVEDCPDERSIRDAVSARLGYEPFTDDAVQTVVAAIRRTADGLLGRVELRGVGGELLGERELESPGFDCREFASALTLSIALAIDPLAMGLAESGVVQEPDAQAGDENEEEVENAVQPAATPRDPTSEAASQIEPEAEVESQGSEPSVEEEDSRDRVAVRVRLNAHGSLGSAPGLAFGLDLQVGVRWRFFSIGLEGRTDLPASDEAFGGQVRSMLIHLSLVPCFHWRVIAGCAVIGGGALRGEGEGYYNDAHQYLQYWTVGGRFAVEVPLVRWLLFHAHLDLLGAPVRVELTIDDVIAWRSSPVAFTFGGGFSASF